MKVTKAVIPAAGFGTRVLPASKAIPKEMLPIVDKPAIQYIVEEAAASGIEDILIILSRGKDAIEDHFDRNPVLEKALEKPGKEKYLESVLFPTKLANIYFIRQPEQKGLGHAVSFAKSFVGDDPFVVLYGDDVIINREYPVAKQLIDAYDEYQLPALGIKQVTAQQILKYSSMKVRPLHDNLYFVDDMIEKPSPDKILSLYSILGRVLLTKDVFPILADLKPGAGGELQLTDAIRELAHGKGTVGVDFVGRRYDMGNKLEMMKAAVEVALGHEEIGADFRAYLKGLQL
ncbi:MAG: UTP--glucose-1-phosphate uridylyltransferase [Oscillospiraceae bacterium]|nr:UTP--glucose-1-phosphate uridylyltransferase [Oscillospiraceae bacterium]